MTASRKSLGSLLCSQQQTRSSWSLLCSTGPPYLQISGGIPPTPAALRLFNCSMALVSSSIDGGSSSSTLAGSRGIRRIAESWTTRSALKRVWKCSDQRLKIDVLSVRSTLPSALRRGLCTLCVGPYTALRGLHRSLCSHQRLHYVEVSLGGCSTTCFG